MRNYQAVRTCTIGGMTLTVKCVGAYDAPVPMRAQIGDPKGSVVFEGYGIKLTFGGGTVGECHTCTSFVKHDHINLSKGESILWDIGAKLTKYGKNPDFATLKQLCEVTLDAYRNPEHASLISA